MIDRAHSDVAEYLQYGCAGMEPNSKLDKARKVAKLHTYEHRFTAICRRLT